jgi:hypothetical protein
MSCSRQGGLTLLLASFSLVCISYGLAADQAKAPVTKRDKTFEKQMIGVWQASQAMGSGWNESIQFFEGGTFKMHTSQIDCQSRERGRSGTWQANRRRLQLAVQQRFVIVGGHLVKSNGSCGSDKMLEGGRLTTRKVTPPQRQTLALVAAKPDETKRMTLRINGKQFWKFSSNPNDYN